MKAKLIMDQILLRFSRSPDGTKDLRFCKRKPKTFYDLFVVTLTLFVLLQLFFYFSLFCWFDVMLAFLLENDHVMRFLDLSCPRASVEKVSVRGNGLPTSFCQRGLEGF